MCISSYVRMFIRIYSLESKQKGRLRLGTRNLYFEPEDVRFPISKYSYRLCSGKPQTLDMLESIHNHSNYHTILTTFKQSLNPESISSRDTLVIQTKQVIEMKTNGIIGPYTTKNLSDNTTSNTNTKSTSTGSVSSPSASSASQNTDDSQHSTGKDSTVKKNRMALFGSSSSSSSKDSTSTSSKGKGTTPGENNNNDNSSSSAGNHVPGRTTIIFGLLHTSGAQVITLAQQLWDIQLSCTGAYSGRERQAIEPILQERKEGHFDLSLLGDYREKPLLSANPYAISCERIYPLVTCPGRIMVTDKAVYFQPVRINNVAGSDPVHKYQLRDILRVQRRTRLQRHVGLEIQLIDTGNPSADASAAGLSSNHPSLGIVFLSFSLPSVRDQVYRTILSSLRDRKQNNTNNNSNATGSSTIGSPSPIGSPSRNTGTVSSTGYGSLPGSNTASSSDYDDELGDPSPAKVNAMTRAWKEYAISNLDYLMFLNSLAGRTQADLTQYPILPWVIADYTSSELDLSNPSIYRDLTKPIGALNTNRLESFRMRYKEMPRGEDFDPPFLYGTHYSTPGYCLYYLVRSMPEHMLRLQAGKFDAPDRMFYDLSATWNGVTGINSDLKELIPEFYISDGSFLLIPDGLDLGIRQSGKRVTNVTLPPWAYDTNDFIDKCRDALESDYVSNHINTWIDLIFGSKQRGTAAETADNLFYYLTYEGAVDMENITDPDKRTALQSQIAEFGQTPRQLFTKNHPSRNQGNTVPLSPSATVNTPSSVLDESFELAVTKPKKNNNEDTNETPNSRSTTTIVPTDDKIPSGNADEELTPLAAPEDGVSAAVTTTGNETIDNGDSTKTGKKKSKKKKRKEVIPLVRTVWNYVPLQLSESEDNLVNGTVVNSIEEDTVNKGTAIINFPSSNYSLSSLLLTRMLTGKINKPIIITTFIDGSMGIYPLILSKSTVTTMATIPIDNEEDTHNAPPEPVISTETITQCMATGTVLPPYTQLTVAPLHSLTDPSALVLTHTAIYNSTGSPMTVSCTVPDGRIVFTAGFDGTVYAVDTRAKLIVADVKIITPITPTNGTGNVLPSAISPITSLRTLVLSSRPRNDGKKGQVLDFGLLVGQYDGTLTLWSVTIKIREKGDDGGRVRVKFSSACIAGLRPFTNPLTSIVPQHSTLEGYPIVFIAVGDAMGQTAVVAAVSVNAAGRRANRTNETLTVLNTNSSTPDDALLIELEMACKVNISTVIDELSKSDLVSTGGVAGVIGTVWLPVQSPSSSVINTTNEGNAESNTPSSSSVPVPTALILNAGNHSFVTGTSDGKLTFYGIEENIYFNNSKSNDSNAYRYTCWPILTVTTGEVLRTMVTGDSSSMTLFTGGNSGTIRMWNLCSPMIQQLYETTTQSSSGNSYTLLTSNDIESKVLVALMNTKKDSVVPQLSPSSFEPLHEDRNEWITSLSLHTLPITTPIMSTINTDDNGENSTTTITHEEIGNALVCVGGTKGGKIHVWYTELGSSGK